MLQVEVFWLLALPVGRAQDVRCDVESAIQSWRVSQDSVEEDEIQGISRFNQLLVEAFLCFLYGLEDGIDVVFLQKRVRYDV